MFVVLQCFHNICTCFGSFFFIQHYAFSNTQINHPAVSVQNYCFFLKMPSVTYSQEEVEVLKRRIEALEKENRELKAKQQQEGEKRDSKSLLKSYTHLQSLLDSHLETFLALMPNSEKWVDELRTFKADLNSARFKDFWWAWNVGRSHSYGHGYDSFIENCEKIVELKDRGTLASDDLHQYSSLLFFAAKLRDGAAVGLCLQKCKGSLQDSVWSQIMNSMYRNNFSRSTTAGVYTALLQQEDFDPNIVLDQVISSEGCRTPIEKACQEQDHEAVAVLVKCPQANVVPDGESLLHRAVRTGYDERASTSIINHLLSREDIRVNGRNADGYTPFFLAMAQGKFHLAVRLLQDGRVQPGIESNRGDMALVVTVSIHKKCKEMPDKFWEVVRILLIAEREHLKGQAVVSAMVKCLPLPDDRKKVVQKMLGQPQPSSNVAFIDQDFADALFKFVPHLPQNAKVTARERHYNQLAVQCWRATDQLAQMRSGQKKFQDFRNLDYSILFKLLPRQRSRR